MRLLASLALKNLVIQPKWENLSQEERQQIKGLLPVALQDSDERLRCAAAVSVAHVARWEWPSQWKDLIPRLVSPLESGAPSTIETALLQSGVSRCMVMMASTEVLPHHVLAQCFTSMLPIALRVYGDKRQLVSIRRRCMKTFVNALSYLSLAKQTGGGSSPQDRQQYTEVVECVRQQFPIWIEAMLSDLCELSFHLSALKIVILECISLALVHFSKLVADQSLPLLLEGVWKTLTHLLPLYLKVEVEGDGDTLQSWKRERREQAQIEEKDSEAALDTLIALALEVFHVILHRKRWRDLVSGVLEPLLSTSLILSQLTDDEDMDIVNAGELLDSLSIDDEEGNNRGQAYSFTVRISASQLCREISQKTDNGAAQLGKCIRDSVQKYLPNMLQKEKEMEAVIRVAGICARFLKRLDCCMFDVRRLRTDDCAVVSVPIFAFDTFFHQYFCVISINAN